MKAIILAAGSDVRPQKHGFPPNSKPKCLYHINGETILEGITSSLRKAGIKKIRVVIGYKGTQIEEYNRKHGLGLETVYNSRYEIDAVNSLLVGVKDVNEDVLILLGDIIVTPEIIRKFVDHRVPLVWIRTDKAYENASYQPVRGKQWCIVKATRKKLKIFRKARDYSEQFLRKSGWSKAEGYSAGLYGALFEALHCNGPVGEIILNNIIEDVDYYTQTDEGKK